MIPAMNILGVLTDFSAPWIHQAALLFAVPPDSQPPHVGVRLACFTSPPLVPALS